MNELAITLFLCGDVMLGRGIDQILPHSNDPTLHEPYVHSARTYVELAEEVSGPIPSAVGPDYVWGEALEALDAAAPDVRIINLETAVTTSGEFQADKGIHYRVHPGNADVLEAAGVDAAVLANNHVLDWGRAGLRETLDTLKQADVQTVGAGRDAAGAAASVRIELSGGRAVRLFAYASPDAGVPRDWSAGPKRPGVNLLPGYGRDARKHVIEHVRSHAQEDEVVVVSIHWGSNWGYRIPEEQRTFARALIDEAGVDVVYGHSSHHPRGIEVHGDRLILYGCGDFLNDYEGISGHDSFRPELTLMYLPELDAGTGALKSLTMVPMRISRLSLRRADRAAAEWLRDRLADHSSGLRFEVDDEPRIHGIASGARDDSR